MEEINNKKNFLKELFNKTQKTPKTTLFKTLLQNEKSYHMFRNDIDECLVTIDFSKIHKVMKALNWTWYMWIDEWGNEHYNEVPSEYAIKTHALDMFTSFINWALHEEPFTAEENYNYMSSCGGWQLRCNVYDGDDKIYFDLTFSLENFSN